jgi:putative FmdB family regulatory protein
MDEREEHFAPEVNGVPMPIFEYVCRECSHKFEAIVSGSQKPECPKCHTKEGLEQQLSTFAVNVKSSPSRPVAPCGMPGGGCGSGGCQFN